MQASVFAENVADLRNIIALLANAEPSRAITVEGLPSVGATTGAVSAVTLSAPQQLRARRETNESSASEERRNRIANALGATRARKAILGG